MARKRIIKKGGSVEGVEVLIRTLKKDEKENTKNLREGLNEAARYLFGITDEVVPVDTGLLQSTGGIDDVTDDEVEPEVILGYGSNDAYYAVYVHEDLEARHAPGKQAKYLEGPFDENVDDMIAIIREQLNG